MENTFSSPGVPPQLKTPPPVITPPPPTPPRRSWGWIIVSIILLVLLGFSLLGNVTQFFVQAVGSGIGGGFNRNFNGRSARVVGPRLDECILEDNDAHNKIAVITVDGIITSQTATRRETTWWT